MSENLSVGWQIGTYPAALGWFQHSCGSNQLLSSISDSEQNWLGIAASEVRNDSKPSMELVLRSGSY
ncbi:hypothetical protein MicloDRAFT_00045920 [Microvirga lotononidis]|uniref:Uncharacterized protein n=1 Tax=Microvirga lotononidis TaxID=864069 RepID=I4YVM3_9HYPH|nr:hypothetical protein MicloDRAFT_00045920 [Microvirga lotononidis]